MPSKILVIGSGGREHAMVRALATGNDAPEIICAPGNPGIEELARCESVKADDVGRLVALAKREGVAMVIPGPEAPLVAGVADALAAEGIPCCGPLSGAAALEGSKKFTRELADTAGVPSPRFMVVTSEAALREAVETWNGLPVVKADGLAGGKGVYLPDSKEECIDAGIELLRGKLGDAGKTVVLEERLEGVEASLFYACDGTSFVALPHARDHKRLLDNDQGPNTGGMGAVSPNPEITNDLLTAVAMEVVAPTLSALQDQGAPFTGFLFAGLMLTKEGPKLLEYNVRLGDPEAQVILPRLQPGELWRLCQAVTGGQLDSFELSVSSDATCGVVLSAAGYPESPRKGDAMTMEDDLTTDGRWLIHAGTKREPDSLVTSGGRVAAVVARGKDPAAARSAAYQGVDLVGFDGMHYRKDIGN